MLVHKLTNKRRIEYYGIRVSDVDSLTIFAERDAAGRERERERQQP